VLTIAGKIKPIEPGETAMMVGRGGFRKKKMPDYKVAYVTMVSSLLCEPL
jgi:hypothetical protein